MFSVEVNRNILKDVGFLKVEQLTTIKRKFYYQALKMKKRVKRMETSKTSLKTKLGIITKNNESYEFKALPKLKENHVPMYKNDKLMNSEGTTVELLLFMDKTFDSWNASKLVSDPGKPLTGAVNIE
ncbi:hypothetical protein ACI65C_005014 [Semiaphis heraclei]